MCHSPSRHVFRPAQPPISQTLLVWGVRMGHWPFHRSLDVVTLLWRNAQCSPFFAQCPHFYRTVMDTVNLPVLTAEFLLSHAHILISCTPAFPILINPLLRFIMLTEYVANELGKGSHHSLGAPIGEVLRATRPTESPVYCIFSCLGLPLLRVTPVSWEMPKRADGERPREEQGEFPSQSRGGA